MIETYGPINPKFPHMLHGGDYNPDQWPEEVWAEDMRLMKLAHCNAMTVGIFSWTHLEPEEGRFEFGWLDRVMDMLAENGAYAVLATPTGARPAWMSAKYPEVLRVRPDGGRNLHGRRHNHCFSSPVYREKTHIINTQLAERYKDHPALLVWHLSNEYGGECHCELCRAAFTKWLHAIATPRWTSSTRPGGPPSGATPTPIGPRSSRPARSARPASTATTSIGSASSPTRPSTSCSTRWPRCARSPRTCRSRPTSWARSPASTTGAWPRTWTSSRGTPTPCGTANGMTGIWRPTSPSSTTSTAASRAASPSC